jgi:ABC-type uncharacterized transport system involved in gliding motility auxiliary subunit
MQTAVLALVGVASLFAGLLLRLLLPGLGAASWAILGVGTAVLALAAIVDFRRVRGALASRRGRVRVGTTVRISLFIGIILLANAISVGTYRRFDLTRLSAFTLTSQTKDVLGKLDTPVEIVNFFSPSVSVSISGYARNLLAEYQHYSERLTVRDVDPDLNPDQARQYQVDQMGAQYGVTVFRGAAGLRLVYGPQITAEAEHAFTSAILEVTGTRQKKIYFLTGHGESGIFAAYDNARSGLQDNLFQVDQLDLQKRPAIPQDAAAVIVAGPRQPLAASEKTVLADYLHADGRLLLLLDPGVPQDYRDLVAPWGVDFADGTIIEPSSNVAPSKDTPLVPRTRDYLGFAQTYFPGAAAFIPQKSPPQGLTIVPLVWSSPESWLAKRFVSGKDPVFNPATDTRGPLAIGALVSTTPPAPGSSGGTGMRLAVIADSDFAANPNFANGNNRDLFLTAANWLAEGVDVISVDRKVLPVRRLILSPEEARFLFVSSIGLLPLALLVLAGVFWWRRR